MSNVSTHFKTGAARAMAVAAVFAVAQFAGSQADALDIENADDEEYTIQVAQEGTPPRVIVVAAKSKAIDVCEEPCTITVENVGDYEAQPGDQVKIQDGQLINE